MNNPDQEGLFGSGSHPGCLCAGTVRSTHRVSLAVGRRLSTSRVASQYTSPNLRPRNTRFRVPSSITRTCSGSPSRRLTLLVDNRHEYPRADNAPIVRAVSNMPSSFMSDRLLILGDPNRSPGQSDKTAAEACSPARTGTNPEDGIKRTPVYLSSQQNCVGKTSVPHLCSMETCAGQIRTSEISAVEDDPGQVKPYQPGTYEPRPRRSPYTVSVSRPQPFARESGDSIVVSMPVMVAAVQTLRVDGPNNRGTQACQAIY